MNTVVRWVGSKRRLAQEVAPKISISDDVTYYEPFAGSAAMCFALEPARAVLGDFNEDLINAYRSLRDEPDAVLNHLTSYPAPEHSYYSVRSLSPSDITPVEQAARFFYLNRYCFNGVYRTNRNGEFNVPVGRRTGALPPESEWRAVSSFLERCVLREGDFREVLRDVSAGDFVYLDPPYSEVASRHRGEFGYGGFQDEDLDELVEELERLNTLGCDVMVSFKDHERFWILGDDWYVGEVGVGTRVAADVSARRERSELLVSNFEIPGVLS